MISFYIHICLKSEYLTEYFKGNKIIDEKSNKSKNNEPQDIRGWVALFLKTSHGEIWK